MRDSTSTERSRRIADELEVRNLLDRVSLLNDTGTVDEYMACWSEDALWDYPDDPRRGHEAIRAAFVERRARREAGPTATTVRHVVTNQTVHFEDPDTITAESYLVYFRDSSTRPWIAALIHNVDTFRRTPEGWKIDCRRISFG